MEEAPDITEKLRAWSAGQRQSGEELFAAVYEELRRLASRSLWREEAGQSLQPTVLVNEAYLRLVDQRRVNWQNRAHFYAIAAQIMRRILVDHARRRAAGKRGGGGLRLSLEEATLGVEQQLADVVALNEALTRLAAFDERKSRVVELLYFGGLANREAAEVLEVSEKTIRRDWQMAKLWLYRELSSRDE